MSANTIRLFNEDQAARGKTVRRRLGMRQQAKDLRDRASRLLSEAAEMLADANELEEAADVVGEPPL
jgi:hypothetical protein